MTAHRLRAVASGDGGRGKVRLILVGTGGHGADWCERILPPFVAAGQVEVVAAVDVVAAELRHAQAHLGVPPQRCYTDLARACDENPADCCAVVVPPEAHESVVEVALAYGLDILCEKPLADTLPAAVRIANKVRSAGARMGVTMSHRFDQDKSTLKSEIASGRHGALDYAVYRFTCNFRGFPRCGRTRHRMPNPLLLDAAVHHLDILADLAGSRCDTVYAETWNPAWGEFQGPSQALITMRFENGRRALYEGAFANAAGLNAWASEYVRAECELSTLVLSRRRLECFPFRADARRDDVREGGGEEVPLLPGSRWEHDILIADFLSWIGGGPPMKTEVEANLESAALMFAAIESGRTGQPVSVSRLLSDAQRSAAKDMPAGHVDKRQTAGRSL